MKTRAVALVGFGLAWAWGVNLTVDADAGRLQIHDGLYGRNNSIYGSYGAPGEVSDSALQLYRDAGLRLLRESGGNNSTKYNWRNRLSSHPDWYNNVELDDWDVQAQVIDDKLPGMQGLFAFQLIGWAADNRDYNFDSWVYNQATWWEGVAQNIAGGGVVNESGVNVTKAAVEGDPNLYLKRWPADSTVGILDYWFGAGGLGLDSTRFRYWSMDNEPEVWNSSHDDVVDTVMSAEQYMQSFFAVATKARAKFPGIKIVGPVFTNEWQWFNWQEPITYKGRYHCWMEYFIRRIGEHQDSTGVRLLDVLDFHFYPQLDASNSTDAETMAQIFRLWYDSSWEYPEANGLKSMNGDWDQSLTHYYIFTRAQAWLDQYLGSGNGVTMGLTEMGAFNNASANQVASWYASQLGTFADHGVEVFCPWDWYVGQWEVMHLFSRYGKGTRVQSTSTADSLVSAYSSISAGGDSLTVILVNHNRTTQQSASVALSNFQVSGTSAATLQLANLPTTETFVSHTQNALASSTVSVSNNQFTLQLPALSVTAVVLTGSGNSVPVRTLSISNVASMELHGRQLHMMLPVSGSTVALHNLSGDVVARFQAGSGGMLDADLSALPAGRYVLHAQGQGWNLALQ